MTSRRRALSYGHNNPKTTRNLDDSQDTSHPTTTPTPTNNHRPHSKPTISTPPHSSPRRASQPTDLDLIPSRQTPSSLRSSPTSSTASLQNTLPSSLDSGPTSSDDRLSSKPHSARTSRALTSTHQKQAKENVNGAGWHTPEAGTGVARRQSVGGRRSNGSVTDLAGPQVWGSTTLSPPQQERIRAFDREKIGLAGKGFGSLLDEDRQEETIGELLGKISNDDILKLTQLTKPHYPKPKSQSPATITSTSRKDGSPSKSNPNLATTTDDDSIPYDPDFHPSQNTLALSRKFKNSLSQKYAYIFDTIARGEPYNPLQALRDRAVRAADSFAADPLYASVYPQDETRPSSHRQVRHTASGVLLGRRRKVSEWLVTTDEMEEDEAWRKANPQKEILTLRASNPRALLAASSSTSSQKQRVPRRSLEEDDRSSLEELPRIQIQGSSSGVNIPPEMMVVLPQPPASPLSFQSFESEASGGISSGGVDSPPRSPRPPNSHLVQPRPVRAQGLNFKLSHSASVSPVSSPSPSPPPSPKLDPRTGDGRFGATSPLSRLVGLVSERENHSALDVSTKERYEEEEEDENEVAHLPAQKEKRKTWHIPLFKKDKSNLLKKQHHRHTSLPHVNRLLEEDEPQTPTAPQEDARHSPGPQQIPPDGGEKMPRSESASSSQSLSASDRIAATLGISLTHDASSQPLPPPPRASNSLTTATAHGSRRRSSTTSVSLRPDLRSRTTSPVLRTLGDVAERPLFLGMDGTHPAPSQFAAMERDDASIIALPPTRRHSFDHTQRVETPVSAAATEEAKKKGGRKKPYFLKVPGGDGTSASEESAEDVTFRSDVEERESGGEKEKKNMWGFWKKEKSDVESDNSSSNRTGHGGPFSLEKRSSVEFFRGKFVPSGRSSFDDETRPSLSEIGARASELAADGVEPSTPRQSQIKKLQSHESGFLPGAAVVLPDEGPRDPGGTAGDERELSRSQSPTQEIVEPVRRRVVQVDLEAVSSEVVGLVEKYRKLEGRVVQVGKRRGRRRKGRGGFEDGEDQGVRAETDDDEAETETETETETEDDGDREEGDLDKNDEEDERAGKGNVVEVDASDADDIGFTKYVYFDDSLIHLHVSMLGESDKDYKSKHGEMKGVLERFTTQIDLAEKALTESEHFLTKHQDIMDDLCLNDLDEMGNWVISRPETQQVYTSSPELSPPSSPHDVTTPRPDLYLPDKRAPSILLSTPYGRLNSFEYTLEETELGVGALKTDIDLLERNVSDTQTLLQDMAKEMRITLDKFEDMTLEISEEYYHHLKLLEDDVAAINAKRAQNPWLDAGYATLSYVLTFIAFVFWFAVQLIKAGRAIAIFPRTLWTAYSEYLEDRKKTAMAVEAAAVPIPPRTLTSPRATTTVNGGGILE
ncbi:hypothetical protein BC938DRAFT_471907 [Jimgerdemannia flammicorona]|uniref:Uncharacterized protein n=1 Tax=Jimgerdemannia flammicorona TaxID=994334 RepID=A0A433QUC0_9FUNG|nr:hypothetical protein BC938DRAFT_471907 [Jimgerdemannia flammicorona]